MHGALGYADELPGRLYDCMCHVNAQEALRATIDRENAKADLPPEVVT